MSINDVMVNFFFMDPVRMAVSGGIILLGMVILGCMLDDLYDLIKVICRGYDPNDKKGKKDAD
jgi:hypothetical protein